jgi:hypothetical protein
LVALNFSVVAAIFAVVFADKFSVSSSALLAVPLASAAIGLSWLEHMAQIQVVGHYIRVRSWPYIGRLAGPEGADMPSWEEASANSNSNPIVQLIIVVYAASAFVVPALVALIVFAILGVKSGFGWLVWSVDVAVTVALLVAAALFAIQEIRGRITQMGAPLRRPPPRRGSDAK